LANIWRFIIIIIIIIVVVVVVVIIIIIAIIITIILNQWVQEALFTGVKLPGRKAHHSPLSSAEVKNAWRYASTTPKSSLPRT
jgi:hypothetical protein